LPLRTGAAVSNRDSLSDPGVKALAPAGLNRYAAGSSTLSVLLFIQTCLMSSVYDFEAHSITGQPVKLDQYRGKVMLIVNTASKCGFTPQFDGLEKLWKELGSKGLVVLGFPCNQFGSQDPGANDEIASFCQLNYGVSFPMMSKIDVNGPNAHPLYRWLVQEAPGILGTKSIKWNFTKFLVDAEGKVMTRYAPTDTPEKIGKDIAAAL
jgi:glutathione peroxidase